MDIEPFGVEIWMNEWETKCEWNLAETCVESLTIDELLKICGKNHDGLSQILDMKMTYGAIEGSDPLRSEIAAFYEKQSIENIVVTHGTIGANMLVHKTLVSRGDRVISVVPTYQQHYSIPASIGADVQHLQLLEKDGFLPDLDTLRSMATPGTKLIAINNPNNPTGSLMDPTMLEEIADIARQAGAWVLCDEVYRGADQHGDGITKSMVDIYEKGISTASTSKAFSLAGLRLGWIAGPADFLEQVAIHRDYDTISVGLIDDHFATMALQNRDKVLQRSHQITRGNLQMLSDWVDQQKEISWIKPKSGTTALLRYDSDISSRELCVDLLHKTGVLLMPGSALSMEGYLRIGYANSPSILKEGLRRFSEYLANAIPVADPRVA
ncbi:MAG: aminotransferase [Rhizobiaceae bacterium]|nr:aminotransferase [Rhizobiaceae bacterium]